MVEAAESTAAESGADEAAAHTIDDPSSSRTTTTQPLQPTSTSSSTSSTSPPLSPPLCPPSSATPVDVSIELSGLVRLFRYFLHQYSVSRSSRTSTTTSAIQHTCVRLFCRDYHCATLDNSHGEYCASYPPTIIVCEAHKQPQPSPSFSSSSSSSSSLASSPFPSRVNDTASLSTLFKLSRFNRVHGRFVCPVLLVDGVNVSRSSTLSIPAEALYNNVTTRTKELIGTLYETMSASFPSFRSPSPPLPPPASSNVAAGGLAVQRYGSGGGGVEEVGGMSAREADEELLRRLSTRYIVDLMVEHRKKKLGVTLTSSEKSESQQQQQQLTSPQPPHNSQPHHQPLTATTAASLVSHTSSLSPPPPSSPPPYADFTITPIPYPGCEFFAMYHNHGRNAAGLVFDWSQSFVDSLLTLEDGGIELEGLELSGEGEDEDGIYEYDTHWACWMQQQQQQQHQHEHNKSSQQRKRAEKAVSGEAASATSDATSAASTQRADTTPPPLFTSPLTDLLSGEEEDADDASGRVRQTSAARDEPAAPKWRDYKDWSVITLTKNYLLLLLHIIASNSTDATDPPSSPSGLSVHCVSGWDRTPLFISLLRLSLWADGEAHASLSAAEMLYLTLAYDWMLFSHHLANRHDKGEDIMYACFDMLQYITADKFSLDAVKRSKQQHRHTAMNGEESASSEETGLPLPVIVTAPEPAVSVPSPTAAATMDDSYFAADGQRTLHPGPPSPSSSSPIPIPNAASATSPTLSPSTPDISMQPASLSPPTAASPLLSSGGGSAVDSSASTMRRNGSWTIIDLLGRQRGKSDANSNSGKEQSAAGKGGEGDDGSDDESPPSQKLLSDSPPTHDMSTSWTAAWTPQQPQPANSTAKADHAADHKPADTLPKAVAEVRPASYSAADVEQAMHRARRCQRLLELRSLFLQTYHAVLPVSAASPAAAILDNHPTCPHFQRAKRLLSQLPTAAASIDGGEVQSVGSARDDDGALGMESLRPIVSPTSSAGRGSVEGGVGGGVSGGKSNRMIPWLPF